MIFGEASTKPPPPFYNLDAPYEDTPILKADGTVSKTKGGKVRMKQEYAGVRKGIKQVLWERGLWKDGMSLKLDDDHPDCPELSASYVLSQCMDFKMEESVLEKIVHSYGELIEYVVKGHPEFAECGIEYDQGLAKQHFRGHNLQNANKCEEDAKKAYHQITLLSAKQTTRKARAYMRAYADGSGESHFLIEKFVQQVKCHRNIFDVCKKELNELEMKQNLDEFVSNVKKNDD